MTEGRAWSGHRQGGGRATEGLVRNHEMLDRQGGQAHLRNDWSKGLAEGSGILEGRSQGQGHGGAHSGLPLGLPQDMALPLP